MEEGDGLREADSEGLYHGGWAFRKETFYRVRGYGPHNNGENQELAGRLHEAGVTVHDPCEHHEPFYIYRYDNSSYRIAQETGISESTLSKFYLGQRGLSMEALNALGECLQLTIQLGRKPDMEEE